jgi:ammonium transporter, Amt family
VHAAALRLKKRKQASWGFYDVAFDYYGHNLAAEFFRNGRYKIRSLVWEISKLSCHCAMASAEIAELQTRIAALEAWKTAMPATPLFDAGNTAWMLCSTALVLLMTLPGLALFYGGMAQVKNVLSTVFQTFSITCMISILWFMLSYSLAFSKGTPVIGGSDRFWLIGSDDSGNQYSSNRIGVTTFHPLAPNIPETVFMMYQMTFAIITAAIVCGSFAGKTSLGANFQK